MKKISKEVRNEEYLYLPSKHGILQIPRYSKPIPTKDGYVQFVSKAPNLEAFVNSYQQKY